MIRAALTAFALLAATPAFAQEASPRYAIDVSVMAKGVEVAAGRTAITEGGQAEIVLTGADGQYTFTADLQPEQGDGEDGRLVLEAQVNHDGAELANPRLILTRGARALTQIGSKAMGANQLTDGIEIGLMPLNTD